MIEQADIYLIKDILENGYKSDHLKDKIEVVATPPKEVMDELLGKVERRRHDILRKDIVENCSTYIKEFRAYSEDGVWLLKSDNLGDTFYKIVSIEDLLKELKEA